MLTMLALLSNAVHAPANSMTLTTAYLCLGSNIQPEENIRFAVTRLQHDFQQVVLSNLYKSPAVGFEGDDFLNIAAAVSTDYPLDELLRYTDSLEQEAGRIRVYRGCYDSRTLDVDVVMYGNLQGNHSGREWPSEDIGKDAHVLLPMSEITGKKKHPILGVEFKQLWKQFDKNQQTLKRVDAVW